MNKYLKYQLIFVFIIGLKHAFSQEKNEVIQQRIEFIAEQINSEQPDLTNITEQLNFYFDHPLNLNNATTEELEELTLLTPFQINELVLHRQLYGKLISIYELQSMQFWDLTTIQQILPFVRIDERLDNLHVSPKEALHQGDYELYLRYQTTPETKQGYIPSSDSTPPVYLGNKDEYYTRFRYRYRTNISIGFTGEKDAGEQFFRGAQKNGFDFYSAHAFFKGGKYLKTIALGDYQIQIGQALNIWSGYAFGKTSDITNIKKNANSIRPYTSVDETHFMRGGAIELSFKKLTLCAFVSRKKVDASSLNDTLPFYASTISSIISTGLHRTATEIEKKYALTEYISGSNLRYQIRNFHIGIAGIHQGYDKSLAKPVQPYNQFDFRGQNLLTLSSDYSWGFRNVVLFGEVTHSSYSSSWANLHGILVSPDSRVTLSILYRNYQRGYHSFYTNGFSEGSNTQNETGIYIGLKTKISQAWTVNTYIDIYHFPWLKYQVNAPSVGHEFLIQPTYKPTKQLEIYGRFRTQIRQKNTSYGNEAITGIENVIQQNLRLNISYTVDESITFKSRIESVKITQKNKPKQHGFILIQDLFYKPKNLPLDLALRYVLFDTDGYDTRIYTYESNAQYIFSIPAYYYQGSRMYFLFHYTFKSHLDVWMRYGVFVFNNRNTIGSGLEQINGPKKSDISVQMRYTF
jgi:hypothetical protein